MGKKVYAIKEGYDSIDNVKVVNKIVNSWDECLKYVKGVKGAKYKSFESLDEANGYLNSESKLLKKGIDSYPMDCLHAYVDGSYNSETERYSYSCVAVKNDVIVYMDRGGSEDNSKKQLRQIAGELEGALKAFKYAVDNHEEKIVLFHDYEGIYHHAAGTWERKESSSKEYFDKVKDYINKGLEIIFVKVDGHTGDIYNEITDNNAKLAINIPITNAVDKALASRELLVKDKEIKEEIIKLVSEKSSSKILIVEKTNKEQSYNIEEIIIKIKECMKANTLNSYLETLDHNIKNEIILTLLKNNN